MDRSRPARIPSQSHQDAFMDALLDGLIPSDFDPLSPSSPKNSSIRSPKTRPAQSQIPSTQFSSQKDLLPSQQSPFQTQNAQKNSSPESHSSSSKFASQQPTPRRQGSLMQFLSQPPTSGSSHRSSGALPNHQSRVGAHAVKDVSSGLKAMKNGFSNGNAITSEGRAKCVPDASPLTSVGSIDSRIDLNLNSPTRDSTHLATNLQEDYDALFHGLEDGWDDVTDDEFQVQSVPVPLCQQYHKCIVSNLITQPEWNASNRRLERTIGVTIKSATSQSVKKLLLCDDWVETLLEIDDEMNLVSLPGSPELDVHQDIITFSRSEPGHLIILIPSLLINTTAVSTAPSCPRRGVLNDRIKNSHNDLGEAVIRGTIVHEVIQNILLPTDEVNTDEENDHVSDTSLGESWPMTKILKEARKACVRHVDDLLMIQKTVDQGLTMISDHLKELPLWSRKYVVKPDERKIFKLQKDAYLSDPRSSIRQDDARPKIGITAIRDIEEEIWSPKYGLKGKIDATIEAAIIEKPSKDTFFNNHQLVTQDSDLFPLEIKTGRKPSGVEHMAQTMLYTLLMSDRYNVNVTAGLLFYTSYNELTRVQAVKAEIRQLFIARNQLASYLHKRAIRVKESNPSQMSTGVSERCTSPGGGDDLATPDIERTLLPEPIDNPQTCSRCYTVDSCMLFRKTIEGQDEIPFRRGLEPLQELYQAKTGHLTPAHASFFTRWESLVSLEERELGKFKKEIWELTAEKRQKAGRAFSDMVIDKSFDSIKWSETAKYSNAIHRFTYCLMSSSSADAIPLQGVPRVVPTQSLLAGQIGMGDPVVVSIEGEKLAIAKGFVCELSPYRIIIGLDHRLESLGPLPVGTIVKDLHIRQHHQPGVRYRIDKDELMAGMGRIRDNLAQLFYADGDYKRRELIVDLRTPEFEAVSETVENSQFAHLNEEQRTAIQKVMSAKDYALILGMPGTGKTTTIAEVIKALIQEGKSILLTSYTHSAVDNILSKLISPDMKMLRLGNIDKISPALKPYTLDETEPVTSVEALEQRLMRPQLVATTCLSINHPIFKRRSFDYCIVDEASQITLPTCLGPLRYARTFVLVGDHHQLPPLVKNVQARDKGLEISLFKLLSENHPEAMVCLTRQYRMNADIMSLSNALVYNGRLQCANTAVSNLILDIPCGLDLDHIHSLDLERCRTRCWLADVIAPERRVVFVDTDKIDGQESITGSLVQNATEARLVVQIVSALLRGGVPASEIGVITPYRQQIKLLVYLLENAPGVEIITADKAQGRDKACVIMTMVRSNDQGQVGELLRDWRRINVCLTRARQKLIILGSRVTLKSSDILRDFLEIVEARKWIYELEPGAELAHDAMSSTFDMFNRTPTSGKISTLGSLKRTLSSPAEKLSPRLRNIRKTHAVLSDLTTHLLIEDGNDQE